MLYILTAVSVAAFLFGSLPLATWASRCLTFGGAVFGVRSDALIRVCTDIAKGAAAVLLGHQAGMDGAQLATIFVVLGHIYPLRAGFGKKNGTGTLLGALIALHPLVGLTALLSWLFAYYVYRYAGLSAVISAVATPVLCSMLGYTATVRIELLILLAAIVIWRHRKCIRRLIDRTETMVTWDSAGTEE